MPYVMAEGTPSQLGLLDWKGSMLTGTGNPTAKGWMNEGSIEISKEAKAVYLQNGIIPVCNVFVSYDSTLQALAFETHSSFEFSLHVACYNNVRY